MTRSFLCLPRSRIGWRAKRSEEHTSELQSRLHLGCRLLLEKKKPFPTIAARNRAQRDHAHRQARRGPHVRQRVRRPAQRTQPPAPPAAPLPPPGQLALRPAAPPTAYPRVYAHVLHAHRPGRDPQLGAPAPSGVAPAPATPPYPHADVSVAPLPMIERLLFFF